MTVAAKTSCGYHLWWHPHNFGRNLEDNLDALRQVVMHFRNLRDSFGMQSLAMAEFV
jgi:hypothetical protein